MDGELVKTTYRLKYVIAFLVVALISIGLLFLSVSFISNKNALDTIIAIVSSILVACILGFVYEYFLREDIMRMNDASSDRVINQLNLVKYSNEIDLYGVFPNASAYNFSDFFKKEDDIAIILNDGRTWVSNHEADLEDRISDSTKFTSFYFVNPESKFLDSLSTKIGVSKESLGNKVRETQKTLIDHCGDRGNVRIFNHDYPTSYSLFLCCDFARLVPYPIARKADKIPMFIFQNKNANSYYKSIERDINMLTDRSVQVFPV